MPGASSGPSDPVSDPGDEAPASPKQPEKPRNARTSTGRTEVELEVSRQRSIGWTIFYVTLGGLLVWKLGTVGVWVGVALLMMGAYHAWSLLQTLLYAAGTIVVSDREVSLPRGLCMPRPVVANRQDITAAYFLRRSVPWNRAAPVLIIELGPKAMAFPRDWFASEADQRHVIHALLRDKPDGSGDAETTSSEVTLPR